MPGTNTFTYRPPWDKKRIALHVTFWLIFFLYNHIAFAPYPFQLTGMFTTSIFVFNHIVAVYINFLVLMPRFFERQRYFLYGLSLLLLCVLSSVNLGLMIFAWFEIMYPPAWDSLYASKELFVGTFFGSTTSYVFLTTVIRMVRQRTAFDKWQRQLEKEKLETELKFLKNQLNPHFLFNALNSIYFLIKKDPDLAADKLAGFSDLLRYQLYGANDASISLKAELDFLKKYADLAQLRKKRDLQVHWQLPERVDGLQIPPLVLLPFVENAFKHVAHERGWIKITAELDGESFLFSVSNNCSDDPIPEPPSEQIESGGIGLVNVRRRLALLYPDQQLLQIQQETDHFEVRLRLPVQSTVEQPLEPENA
ncbi:MAG: histidine kinase [Bacteroidota bacterium]